MSWLDNLKELLSRNETNPAVYQTDILKMEDVLNAAKRFYNFVPEHSNLNLFGMDTDTRLKLAKGKLEVVQRNPAAGMKELLEMTVRNFQNWIWDNQIGHVHEIGLNGQGILKVHVYACVRERNSYGNTPKKEIFQMQLQKLRDYGFELCKSKHIDDLLFVDSDNNKKLFYQMLKPFGVDKIDFIGSAFRSAENDIIKEYIFRMKPEMLLSLTPNTIEEKTQLNQDDFDEMMRELNNFVSALATANSMPDLANLCVNCMEGHFSFICKKLNVETKTSKTYFESAREEREKNMQIREIESEIAKLSNFDTLKDHLREMASRISSIAEQNDLFLNNFMVDMYGRASFSVVPSCMGIEEFKKFKTCNPYDRHSDLSILDTEQNQQIFKHIFPVMEMTGYSCKVKNGYHCITQVEYSGQIL